MKKMELIEKVEAKTLQFIKLHTMISAHETILLGISGGADSMCLLFLLVGLKKELGCELEVVHINHMLRETANRDEQFVKDVCNSLGLCCHVRQIAVEKIAQKDGLGIEETARRERYRAFLEIKKERGMKKIAVAHHINDQAETMLFHLCRGSGLDGMTGMKPVRDAIIRPLLCLTREEIEAYLYAKQIAYVTDETNFDNIYARNILRNEVLPVLEEKVCHGCVRHMANTASLLQDAQDFLKCELNMAVSFCKLEFANEESRRGNLCTVLSVSKLRTLHPYLQNEVLRSVIGELAGSRKDLSFVHVNDCHKLMDRQVGSKIMLKHQLTVEKSYDALLFVKQTHTPLPKKGEKPEKLIWDGKDIFSPDNPVLIEITDVGTVFLARFDMKKDAVIPTKAYTKWFDYDKIKAPLFLRTVEEKDYFYFDDTHKKLVKDYMKDEKIPNTDRAHQLIIAQGNHMLYFIGKRISNFFKVTNETKRVLEISFIKHTKEEAHEREN